MNFPISDLLDLALKGSLILGAATFLSLALHKASAALRHLVWFVAVLGILALPLASARLSSLEVAWFPNWEEPAPATTHVVAPTRTEPIPSTTEIATLTTPLPTPAPVPLAETPVDIPQRNWPVIAWVAGILVCVMPYVIGLIRLGRTTRAATLVGSELQADVDHASQCLALNRRVTVKIGDGVRMPMTWGALFPVVLLPPEFADWTEHRRRIVLLHELAHVKRFDWFTQLLAGAAAAIYWFNPLAWLAARRMRIEREQACDDLVLRSGSKASDYADELLQIANDFGDHHWDNRAAIPMARRSSLECRLRSILADGRERRSLKRWIIATACVVMTGIVVPIAMLQAAETGKTAPAEENRTDKKTNPTEARYRNWVMAATNTNTPFDDFALAQIAGDIQSPPKADDALMRAAMQQGLKDVRLSRQDGRIVFQADRWTVTADSAEVDQQTGKIQFRGKVVVKDNNQEFKGSALSIGPDGMEGDIAWGGGTPNRSENVRSFVRLVMGTEELTFEGKRIQEDAVRRHLSGVSNRQHTVLELAVTTDELSWRKVNEFKSKYALLANELGFEHASFIGVHKAATKGSPAQPREKNTSQAIDAMGNPAKPETAQWNVASQLQKRLVELAKRQMDAMRLRVEAGAASQEEYDEAAYQYEVAKDPDNKLRHAELKMKLLHNRLRRLKARSSVSTAGDIQKAEMEQLQAELEYLRLKDASTRRIDSRQDPNTSSEYWNSVAVRYQDPVLNELLISYSAQLARITELRKKYLEQHPIVRESKHKLTALEKQIGERIQILGSRSLAAPKRSNQKPRTKAERAALLEQLKKLSGAEQWNVLGVVHDDPILAGLIAKRNAHEQTLLSLRKSLGPKHPKVLQEQESLMLLKEQLLSRANAILKGMEIEIAALAEAEPRRFTVMGRVKASGVYELPAGTDKISLLDAIAMAGGFERHANSSSIKVRRREDDREKVYVISAKKLSEDPEAGQFYILPGDRISVPDRIF